MDMNSLINKYDGRSIQDDGAYKSPELKQFFRDFKKVLKDMPGVKTENVSLGHYDVSGFLSGYGNICYFSLMIPRGGLPMEMYVKGAMNGILYRQARDMHDYTGGVNHFTSYRDFEKDVSILLKKGGER